jgi:hypothetical protein
MILQSFANLLKVAYELEDGGFVMDDSKCNPDSWGRRLAVIPVAFSDI